jgi:hypothetical protein
MERSGHCLNEVLLSLFPGESEENTETPQSELKSLARFKPDISRIQLQLEI